MKKLLVLVMFIALGLIGFVDAFGDIFEPDSGALYCSSPCKVVAGKCSCGNNQIYFG